MKRIYVFVVLVFTFALAMAQGGWKPVGDRLKTAWAEQVDATNPWAEYPRPIMERGQWQNLNGMWDYAILDKGRTAPESYDGKILVPYCIESSLSGVMKTVGEKQELWYQRRFAVPSDWKGRRVMLHFGAVDWQADVYVNDIYIGRHQGGYTSFSFDITPYLKAKGDQKLVVCVWDPTDKGYQPTGKQTHKPGGIWYTSVTGIWQTVWLEPVGENHITRIESAYDLSTQVLTLQTACWEQRSDDIVEAQLYDGDNLVAKALGVGNGTLRMYVANPKLWWPESPYLYDLRITMRHGGKQIDEVRSYVALRQITALRDWDQGFVRMQLNGENYFQMGLLDQGWYPDGLYTAATDEAMLYDLRMTKELGFNMIRKHVKVEPDRWYYYCDRMGILVWQDMPSGDKGNNWEPYKYNGGSDKERSAQSRKNYYAEWEAIVDQCGQHPSVVVWVPFNEAWGQFETEKVVEWTKERDPSRLVNPASGGNHRDCGDIFDFHHYPHPAMFLSDPNRVNVLGEYGGIGLALEGHLWFPDKNWGYVKFQTQEEVTEEYVKYAEQLKSYVARGFSGAVYTQTTDVEGEVNGLITYDRKELKVDKARIRKANEEIIHSLEPIQK